MNQISFLSLQAKKLCEAFHWETFALRTFIDAKL
jgi:hypothetical protein